MCQPAAFILSHQPSSRKPPAPADRQRPPPLISLPQQEVWYTSSKPARQPRTPIASDVATRPCGDRASKGMALDSILAARARAAASLRQAQGSDKSSGARLDKMTR